VLGADGSHRAAHLSWEHLLLIIVGSSATIVLLGIAEGDYVNSEPITISGAIGIVLSTGLTLISLFGVQLTPEQMAAVLGFGNAVIILAVMIYSRARSTSLSNPTLAQGTTVTVVTPEGQPNSTTTL